MIHGNRWLAVLGTTLILWAVSERAFWSMWRPGEHVGEMLMTLLMYGIATYIMLWAIEYYHVSTLPGLLLVGALYGWIIEGVIAMTTFGLGGIPLPFSLSWTALAWHMPFSVVLMWWWHHQALVHSLKQSLIVALAFGLGWGMWSMTWFFETEPIVTTLGGYAMHVGAVTCLMMLGHMLVARPFSMVHAPRIERMCIFGVVGLFFAAITVPTVPLAAVVLPILAFLLHHVLRLEQRQYPSSSVLEAMCTSVLRLRLLTMLTVPLIATGCYSLMLNTLIPMFPINFVVLAVMTTIGFGLFSWAMFRIYRSDTTPLH